MSEFDRACDWDLHAIVKAQTTNNNTIAMSPYASCYHHFDHPKDYETILNELEELCKPFPYQNPTLSSPKIIHANALITSVDFCPTNTPKKRKHKPMSANNTRSTTSRRRIRNKHKIRSVRQAVGDHLLSDKWKWRKYGEKAIKGSLYRRSYYRCSNSGGCVARKQVEQSSNDPEIFRITYIDEHSHPCPIRRHSQSRHNVRRSKASTKVLSTNKSSIDMPVIASTSSYSPIIEEKCDNGIISVQVLGGGGGVNYNHMINMEGENEHFFAGLDFLEGLEMDLFSNNQLLFDSFSSNVA